MEIFIEENLVSILFEKDTPDHLFINDVLKNKRQILESLLKTPPEAFKQLAQENPTQMQFIGFNADQIEILRDNELNSSECRTMLLDYINDSRKKLALIGDILNQINVAPEIDDNFFTQE